jgi:hypothetical protein
MSWARVFLVLSALTTLAACGDVLRSMHGDHTGGTRTPPPAPRVTLAPLTLVAHPSAQQLAAHYCPELAAESPLGRAAAAACRALGPTPSADDLAFRFRVEMTFANNSSIVLPVASALLAFTAFPESEAPQSLGTLCLSLCDEGAADCPQATADCQSNDPDVHDLDSFRGATEHFLTSVALGQQHFGELAVRTVPPHGQVELSTEVAVASEPMLALIRQTQADPIASIRNGQTPSFSLPYAIEGTAWIEVESYPRVAAPIPRVTGSWDLGATP